jgi:four helix bundle protein
MGARKEAGVRCGGAAEAPLHRNMLAVRPNHSHRSLIVWQRAVQLSCACYRAAKKLPHSERFELGAQLRTACISVTANIAEGKGRRTKTDYARFLAMARGSAREVDSHLQLALALDFLQPSDVTEAEALADEVMRMLTAMLRKLVPF